MVRNDDGGSVTGKTDFVFSGGVTTPLSSLLWFTTLASCKQGGFGLR